MGRSIVIKLAILLVVAALVYSAFWFFKIGQVEKQIKGFVNQNATYVSAGEITVSGFPLSQKITIKNLKFTIPNSALDENQVLVPHLEATAGVLSSDYSVSLIEPVSIQDLDENVSNVEFNSEPEITVSIVEGSIAKFHYQDSGYRITDKDGKVIYSSTNSSVTVSSKSEAEKTVSNISVNIREIEGFDIASLYKNVLEKKIIDGIKTGEIMLGSNSPAVIADQSATTTAPTNSTTADANAKAATPTTTAATTAPATAGATPANTAKTPAAPATNVATTATTTAPVATTPAAAMPATATATTTPGSTTTPPTTTAPTQQANAAPTPAPAEAAATANIPVPSTIADTSIVKSDLTLELEYTLTPAHAENQQANTPPDPTQIQEVPSQYNKSVKIISLEFSNPLYSITVSGELSSLPDDNLPSGGVAVRVDKVDNLITQLSTNFSQMAEKLNKPAAETKAPAAEQAPTEATATAESKPAEAPAATNDLLTGIPTAPIGDPYQTFLTRVSANLAVVAKEIAAKNAVSKDNVAEFDIRREKNLEFLINETSTREILGKF